MTTNHPYLEYLYSTAPGCSHERTLVISFPGRKGNRLATTAPNEKHPFLSKTLNNSNADILFIRSVYEDNPSEAYISRDYNLLPELISELKTTHNIKRLVLFGFSLGCGPCLWLAKKNLADEVVLLAPGTLILTTLMAIDDLRWQMDFENFERTGQLPKIEKVAPHLQMKILHGLNMEKDRPHEEQLVQYLKALIPQASIEGIQGVGHYIPQYWLDKGILEEKIFDILNLKASVHDQRPQNNLWSKLDETNAITSLPHANISQTSTHIHAGAA